MAILNRLSAILPYCDSTQLCSSLAVEFLAIPDQRFRNRAIRDSPFCAAKVSAIQPILGYRGTGWRGRRDP